MYYSDKDGIYAHSKLDSNNISKHGKTIEFYPNKTIKFEFIYDTDIETNRISYDNEGNIVEKKTNIKHIRYYNNGNKRFVSYDISDMYKRKEYYENSNLKSIV